ncbi:hypothetical protein PA598K_00342 [Paenibacillus sp. 598K]|uniref:DUF1273 domain-containing protein n=1 Tax=Paenibacillus sp. 598K TaxID=1117987 RepID=UPI000FFAFC6B|nr:DUF1273 domain-containing protein [Paenibacillus sp. 598K]GBF72106.1 hypothetical protein PA598K_00342 [Paenibacillus sp. 598K]
MKNLLVTGYRAHELNIYDDKHPGIPFIKQAIRARLIGLAEAGLEWVITPGQYGVDLWACEVVLELRELYPGLRVSILAAYEHPEANWKEEKQTYYRELTQRVDYYGVVSQQPYQGTWQLAARDDLLLRKSDGILLFYDEERGEASPRFIKQRAWRKHEREGYGYYLITAEEVQALADEAQYESYVE